MSSDAQAAFGEPSAPKRPSALGYWVAAMVGVAAVAGAVVWFVAGIGSIGDAVDDLQRIPVPGTRTVPLEAGKNAVYLEDGDAGSGVTITIRKVGGAAVDVGPHGGDTTYDVGGHHGVSVAGFALDDDGDYAVGVDGEGGTAAVGKGIGGHIVSAVVGGLGLFFGGLLLCGLLILLTARARRVPTAPPAPTPR